jgi:Protein of unknown function (DUF2894)
MPSDSPMVRDADPLAAIDEWRARGEDRLDPVRLHFIEALARRAGGHDGEARRILDQRVGALLATYAADLAARQGIEAGAATSSGLSEPSPLTRLLEDLAPRSSCANSRLSPTLLSEPKALDYFRTTWSRLSAERRFTQSSAKVPKNAGPLNSHHLVHRSLMLMRDLSPGYFERFMAHVDGLLGLDQFAAVNAPPVAAPATDATPRKAARAKGKKPRARPSP